jgi:hypothetical protein
MTISNHTKAANEGAKREERESWQDHGQDWDILK